VEKCGNNNQETAKIGIFTPLISEIYFRFVTEKIGVDPTTFLYHMLNLVKIAKELRTYCLTTDVFTETHTYTKVK